MPIVSRVLTALLTVALLASAARADALDKAFEALPGDPSPTRIRLITGNHDAWYARWHALSIAKKTIDCTYFHVAPDFIGESLIAKLLEKAREGVKIRLLVDQRGSLALGWGPFSKDYLPALATFPNVQVRTYNAFRKEIQNLPANIRAAIASSHAKMLIVDGEHVIAGGRNVQQHWFADPADDPEAYHDADFFAQGEGIGAQAKRAFDDEFGLLTNMDVKPLSAKAFAKAAKHLDAVRGTMDGLLTGLVVPGHGAGELGAFRSMNRYAQFVAFPSGVRVPVALIGKHSAAHERSNPITDSILSLIDAARHELSIGHAYMVLTDKIKAALRRASARGVKIRFLTNSPDSTDSFLTQAWFVKEWKTYLRDVPGMRILAVRSRKLHGKVIVVDRRITICGSYNMDPMSETINAEDAAVVQSRDFAAQTRAWLDEVAADAIEYRIRVKPDGTVEQVVGPSDHVNRAMMLLLRVIGSLEFLRPLV